MPHLQVAGAPVVLDEVVLVQQLRRAVGQVQAAVVQGPVRFGLVQGHTVQLHSPGVQSVSPAAPLLPL